MNWTAASRSVLPGLCLLVATGCQDYPMPTEPARTHVGRADAQAVGLSQRPGSTPYLCYTSVATPEGDHLYRYGRMYLHFPGHPQTTAGGGTAGASVRYQFRYISVDGTVKRAANCVIPGTEAAVRMMNRRFATDESNGVDRLPTSDGSAVIQTVALEEIVVEASGCSNPDWERDDSGVCWPPSDDSGGADGGDPWGGGDDDPWGGSGGGGIGSGDDPEPPEPDEPEEPLDDEEFSCIDLGCDLRDPTAEELQRIHEIISSLRSDGFCGEVRSNALQMVNRGLKVWDNRVYIPDGGVEKVLLGEAPWDYEAGGPVMYLWTGAFNGTTVAHEALHGTPANTLFGYYTHADTTPLGSFDDTARSCAGG